MVSIIARRGDITKEAVDAIVNPANSYGLMGGGVAYAIKKNGGQDIENEAVANAPISVGAAIATTGGKLSSNFVIHAPTMEKPAMRIPIENVERATKAALECASRHKCTSITFPGMGTGVGGVSNQDAALVMVKTIRAFFTEHEDTPLKKVILLGYGDELYNEFESALHKH